MENILKKIVAAVLCISLCFLTACMRIHGESEKRIFDDGKKIIKAITEKDSGLIKQILSENATKNIDDVDDKIDQFINFFEGEVLSYEFEGAPAGMTSVDAGLGEEYADVSIGICVETTKKRYEILLWEVTVDSEEPGKIGVCGIEVVDYKFVESERWFHHEPKEEYYIECYNW